MGSGGFENLGWTSDLQESILNQFKVPKKKIQLGNLGKDHIAGTRTLSFTNFRPTNFLNGEGNGTSLQYSCLENPVDGAAW